MAHQPPPIPGPVAVAGLHIALHFTVAAALVVPAWFIFTGGNKNILSLPHKKLVVANMGSDA